MGTSGGIALAFCTVSAARAVKKPMGGSFSLGGPTGGGSPLVAIGYPVGGPCLWGPGEKPSPLGG